METFSVVLTGRKLCDLEILLNGGFKPLTGYLKEKDYKSVCDNMTLSTGEIWPMPIVFKISEEEYSVWKSNSSVILKDNTNLPLAKFNIEEIYRPDLKKECLSVFDTDDTNHPYVKTLLSDKNVYYVGGSVELLNLPFHFDYQSLRMSPEEVKSQIKSKGWTKVVGFQTRNPMHKSHQQLTLRSLKILEEQYPNERCGILLHPIVGITQDCDIDYHCRVKCYKKLLEHYDKDKVILSLLPLSMRMGGPREALWHALIRKNYGCSHFIVGRDHAGPSYRKKNGEPFYDPYGAHSLVTSMSDKIGIDVIMSKMIVYQPSSGEYLPIDNVTDKNDILTLSGTQLRECLKKNKPIPSWFTYPSITKILKEHNSDKKNGLCIYLVGLSGSGKSFIARALQESLNELVSKPITILDGDIVRQELSKGLGFTRKDRSLNVRRIGYVASEIVKHSGIVICSNIAPYQDDRLHNRNLISKYGTYLEVYINSPLELCESRDCKGLYKLAREGKIKEFTGISDPFEPPVNPDFTFVSDNTKNINKKIMLIIERLRKDNVL